MSATSANVHMEHDGARFCIATLPTEREARQLAGAIAQLYASAGVPLFADL